MMAKDPAGRPPSAVAVEEELRTWATGEPVLPLDSREDAPYQESIAVLAEGGTVGGVQFAEPFRAGDGFVR